MSTGTRIPLAEAQREAQAFADLFGGVSDRWVIAGSIRRECPDVGDIEHVVLADPDRLWERLDSLMPGTGLFESPSPVGLSKAVYPDGSHRWGQKYRGVVRNGIRHEIFLASATNWGSVLAIRTGPWEFSKSLVIGLYRSGLRNDGGMVVKVSDGTPVPCPTEQDFFEFAGAKWREPKARTGDAI